MTTPYNQTRETYTLYSPTSMNPLQRIREPLDAPMSHSAVLTHNSLMPATPSQLPTQRGEVVEGLVDVDEQDVVDLYNKMNTDTDTQRKYDMDRHISYPPSHPEFAPTEKDIMIKDSTEIMNQQYNTMIMTIAATASLGLIAYMVSTSTSPPSA